MKLLLSALSVLSIIFVSCKKDNKTETPVTTPVVEPKFEDIVNKYLICDSIVIRLPGAPLKGILGKGKGEDIKLRSDGKYVQYYVGGAQEIYYQYNKPDTLYLWGEGQSLNKGIYHNLKIVSKNKVMKVENKLKESYYTVEE